jgi:hypothetical protein
MKHWCTGNGPGIDETNRPVSIALPYVRGYGTILFQFVVLDAYAIIWRLSCGPFTEHHQGVLWSVTFFLNMAAFCVVACHYVMLSRTRAEKLGRSLIVCWTVPHSVTNGQMIDIAVKYLKDRPEERHLSAAILVVEAMTKAFPCSSK